MSKRDLTTTRSQVFGDVKCGTECRICGRNVEDGRSKTCSDYCGNLLSAVMGMLNWTSLRRRITDRDDDVCQKCEFDMKLERKARSHIRDRIKERVGPKPEGPGMSELDDIDDHDWERDRKARKAWRRCRERFKSRYGDPYEEARSLEVDHIQPIADGGHPFDPGNLQTLCSECHQDKTSRENSERFGTPSRGEMSESLFEYVADGGETDE